VLAATTKTRPRYADTGEGASPRQDDPGILVSKRSGPVECDRRG
jgi:hypothetical protein